MLVDASPLKRSVVEGTDIMVIRELTGGLYFGEPRGREEFADGGARAVNTMAYTSREIERVARVGFDVARSAASAWPRWTRPTCWWSRSSGGKW